MHSHVVVQASRHLSKPPQNKRLKRVAPRKNNCDTIQNRLYILCTSIHPSTRQHWHHREQSRLPVPESTLCYAFFSYKAKKKAHYLPLELPPAIFPKHCHLLTKKPTESLRPLLPVPKRTAIYNVTRPTHPPARLNQPQRATHTVATPVHQQPPYTETPHINPYPGEKRAR